MDSREVSAIRCEHSCADTRGRATTRPPIFKSEQSLPARFAPSDEWQPPVASRSFPPVKASRRECSSTASGISGFGHVRVFPFSNSAAPLGTYGVHTSTIYVCGRGRQRKIGLAIRTSSAADRSIDDRDHAASFRIRTYGGSRQGPARDAPPAKAIAGRAADQDQRAEHQHVGIGDPLRPCNGHGQMRRSFGVASGDFGLCLV
jgi:hypothetical protein